MAAPQLFGVAFKKHRVKLSAEAINIEIFERCFGQFFHDRGKVRKAGSERGRKSHGADCREIHFYGIVKKFSAVIDSRHALPAKHYAVSFFRIGAVFRKRDRAVQDDVVERRRALQRHQIFPPFRDAGILGKETVAADVHPVTVVADSFRNSADFAGFFKDCHVEIFSRFQEFNSRRQSRRTRADDCDFHSIAPFAVNRICDM